jgi:predicted O-linked N-acetylglucosamine transferase (SPINDLY family)
VGDLHSPTAGDLHSAVALWQRGRFDEAAATCRAILARQPENADALNLLAAACAQTHRYTEAVEALARAIELRPKDAVLRSNLGNALRAAGNTERALQCYREAIRLQPDYVDAHYNMAVALQGTGQATAAEKAYQEALMLNPSHAAALYNLGNLQRAAGRPREAAASYERALAASPRLVQALNNLGTLLQEDGRRTEAIACYTRALEIQPDFAEAHHSLGGAHLEAGLTEEALGSYQRAIVLDPSNAEAHYSRGNALRTAGRIDEALPSYRRALELRPGLAAAAAEHVYTMLRACEWTDLSEHIGKLRALVDAGETVSPFVMLHITDDPALLQQCARRYARTKRVDAPSLWDGKRYGHERTRVAYLSPDFRDHPVGTSIVELLEHHERSLLEVTLVSFTRAHRDRTAERCRAASDRYLDAHDLSQPEVAAWLRKNEVDIIVDLMGYTAGNRQRVLACRPAPAAVAYLGYPGTLGAGWVDYLIADSSVIPPEEAIYYDEEVLRLPGTFMPTDTTVPPATGRRRSHENLPEDAFVFCCFNHPAKITPAVFDVWMSLLRQVDRSVLWLQASTTSSQQRLLREARARGVDASRLVFASRVRSREEYLGRLRLADLFVDTHPYNAHSTARDALWAGLPVLTCAGRSFASRVGASLLNAVGLTHMIAGSLEQYSDLAVRFARDPVILHAAREQLDARHTSQGLFSAVDLCKDLEAVYLRIAQAPP